MAKAIKIIEYDFAKQGGEEGIKDMILETCIKIHANAVTNCPFKYGQLKNSLMYKTFEGDGGFNSQEGEKAPADQKLKQKASDTVGYVGTGSDHWFPEFGTRFMMARPFLRPALDAVRGASADYIKNKWGKKAMEDAYKKRKKKETIID